ncbi:MAG TPA: hypothetical protein VGI45_10515 [Terracidiphilus sp.]|jgi:hypothetical protein
MFERSNNISVLKTRIRHLQQRKERMINSAAGDDPHGYWLQSDLERIETQLGEAQAELARMTEEITG